MSPATPTPSEAGRLPQKKRRILFFTRFPPPHTGQNIGTLLTYQMLEKQGADLDSINTSSDLIRPSTNKVATLKYMVTYGLTSIGLLSKLFFRVRGKRYDALYMLPSSSAAGQLKDAAALFVMGRRVPLIVGHIRNGNYDDCFKPGRRRKLGRFVASRVSKFIFLSEGLSDRLADHIPAEKRVVIMNPIDENLQVSDEVAAEKIARLRDRKPLKVLFLGNMIKTKGYEDLLAAAALLKGRIDFELHYVGAWLHDNDRIAFEEEVKRLGVEKQVHHHGKESDRTKVCRHFLDSHVFVLPTYYPNEAQPRSIIEGMSCGCAIVATRHASIPEYVTDGVEGYLVAKQSPQEIADALAKLADPAEWERCALNSRRKYVESFTPAKLHEQLCDVLQVDYRS